MAAGGVQTYLVQRGGSLLPDLRLPELRLLGRGARGGPAEPAMAFGAEAPHSGSDQETTYQPAGGSSPGPSPTGPSPTRAMPTEHLDGPA
jgi:hypothetical protein